MPLRPTLHRWFVHYNPTYLLSAALVFVGCFLWSRSNVEAGNAITFFGIPLVVEAYAAALLGGAALLTRVGQRRPAVFLAILAMIVQWDTTLHTEACAYLGPAGLVASLAWLAMFAAKLAAFSWALRVKLSRQLVGFAALGALGLVAFPWVLAAHVSPGVAEALLAAWAFGLGSFDVGTGIESTVPLDAWGTSVLRRTTTAAWIISFSLLALHALWWGISSRAPLGALVLASPLVALRRVRSEVGAFAIVAACAAFTAAAGPSDASLSVVLLLSTVALGLRMVAPRFADTVQWFPQQAPPDVPYRRDVPAEARWYEVRSPAAPLSPNERTRAIAAALATSQLGLFRLTHPEHVLALDLAFVAIAVAVTVWRRRAIVALPALAMGAHLAIARGWLPLPSTAGEWGASLVVLGFATLFGSLAISARAARTEPMDASSGAAPPT